MALAPLFAALPADVHQPFVYLAHAVDHANP